MSIPLRVLIVEDSAADAELLLWELRRGGYEPIYERVDTPEATRAALQKQNWDIVISDYVMPRFSGLAALKIAQESGLDLPFIVVTGQIGEATAIETLTAGAHDYIMKGNTARLIPAVKRALHDAVLRRERSEAIEALRKAHVELRAAYAELEKRVAERTTELARANRELESEIAERMQAEAERERLLAEVRQRAAQLDGIINGMVDAVFVCDRDGQITLINAVARGILETQATEPLISPENLARLNVRHLDGRPVEQSEVPLARALGGEVVWGVDSIISSPANGQDRYVRISAVPLRDAEGAIAGAVAVVSDITELVELDKLKDDFLRAVAHELNTPLAGIKGYTQLLLQYDKDLSDRQRATLTHVHEATDRMARIVRDLLLVSHMQLGRFELHGESLDLADLVRQVSADFAVTSGKHRVLVDVGEPVVLRGDRERLAQALTNLLSNAVKYSPAGGDIEVTLTATESEAMVAVKDGGIGIPADKQGLVFDRFYRAHQDTAHDYGGLGLGLFIAREIVMHHGGHIWFDSSEGIGSTFYFTIPRGTQT